MSAPIDPVTVCWEFADGSGGHHHYGDQESAESAARAVAEEWADARVWCGDCQIQQGFVAEDERTPA
jgi:hypothetical protein